MKRTTLIRQAIAAEQIKKALEDRGLSNKQFVNEDILTSGTLPKVKLPLQESEIVKKYAGIIKVTPSAEELESDERLARIWKDEE